MPPRRVPPFLVRASGTVALKVAQVPSTEEIYSVNAYRFKHPTLVLKVFRFYLENYETF